MKNVEWRRSGKVFKEKMKKGCRKTPYMALRSRTCLKRNTSNALLVRKWIGQKFLFFVSKLRSIENEYMWETINPLTPNDTHKKVSCDTRFETSKLSFHFVILRLRSFHVGWTTKPFFSFLDTPKNFGRKNTENVHTESYNI